MPPRKPIALMPRTALARPSGDFQAEETPVEVLMGEGLLDHILRRVAADRRGQQRQDWLHGRTGHARANSERSTRKECVEIYLSENRRGLQRGWRRTFAWQSSRHRRILPIGRRFLARASGKKGAGGKIFVESRQTALDPSRRRMYLTLLFVLFRRDFSENAGFRTLPGRQNGRYSPEAAATLSIVST